MFGYVWIILIVIIVINPWNACRPLWSCPVDKALVVQPAEDFTLRIVPWTILARSSHWFCLDVGEGEVHQTSSGGRFLLFTEPLFQLWGLNSDIGSFKNVSTECLGTRVVKMKQKMKWIIIMMLILTDIDAFTSWETQYDSVFDMTM